MFTFSKWVEGVYHELEDAVPHEAVVERGRASTSLETWLGLSRKTRWDAVSSQKLRAVADRVLTLSGGHLFLSHKHTLLTKDF